MSIKKSWKHYVSCLLMLLLFLPALAHASGHKLTVKYDKVRDLTTVDTKIEWIREDIRGKRKTGYEGVYSYPGTTPICPTNVTLILIAYRPLDDRYIWSGANEVFFLYGDTRVSYPARYVSEVEHNLFGVPSGHTEVLGCAIPTDDFIVMSHAKDITFEINDKTFDIKGGNLTRIVALAKSLPPADKDTQ